MVDLSKFDRMVAKTSTVKLTSNTAELTTLPDEFEPTSQSEADLIANRIP